MAGLVPAIHALRACRVAMPRVARGDRLAMPPARLTPHGEEGSGRSASRTMRPAKIAKDCIAQINAAKCEVADRHQDRDDERRSFFPVEASRQDDATFAPLSALHHHQRRAEGAEFGEGVCGGMAGRVSAGGGKGQRTPFQNLTSSLPISAQPSQDLT